MFKTICERVIKLLKKDPNYTYNFNCTYTDSEAVQHSYTVFNDDYFRTIVGHQFGGRLYSDFDPDTEDIDDLIVSFKADFAKWALSRADLFAARMYALSLKYEPLNDFSITEKKEGSFTHGENIELSFTNRKDVKQDDSYTERSFDDYTETEKDDSYVERSYDDLTEENTIGLRRHEEKISADDDSLGYVPSKEGSDDEATDSTVTSGSYKDQKGFTNGKEKEISGSIKDQKGFTEGEVKEKQGKENTKHSGKDEEEYTIEKYGNQGNRSEAELLQQELDLLKNDIAMLAVKEFLERFTYVNEEVD